VLCNNAAPSGVSPLKQQQHQFGYHERRPVSAEEAAAYLESAIEMAGRAGQLILPHFRNDPEVENKRQDGGYDPVTIADRVAETAIRTMIAERYPQHGIFGEEQGFQPGNGLTWVVDPIDGTRAFMTGMLHWGVLIALFDGVEPVLGVMHQPFTDEFWVGTNEAAEYRRGEVRRPLSVRAAGGVADAVMGSTGPQFFAAADEQAAFNALREDVRFTRFGGDCYLYAGLAMGQLDLVVEAGLNAYDIQALMPIIRGAGGIVTTWEGGDASMGGRIIAAGDAGVHGAALAILERGR
jgi:myo-inositol-1(or 4)-monophosphatase